MRMVLLLIAMSVFSVAAADRKPLAITAITAQQAEIRAGVEAGKGRYKDMPANTKQELLSRQADVLQIVEGKASSDELSEEERLDVFNNLEWIEAALNKTEGDQLICRRERTIGSNRVTRVCRTAAQLERERELTREHVDNNDLQMRR